MLTWKKSVLENAYLAYNAKQENVGCLKLERVGAHIHWCWWQTPEFYMSPSCLDAVRQKQKELFLLGRKLKQ